MDVAETNVAIAVEIPATISTGNGRDEPEPRPNEGRMLNILERTMSIRVCRKSTSQRTKRYQSHNPFRVGRRRRRSVEVVEVVVGGKR